MHLSPLLAPHGQLGLQQPHCTSRCGEERSRVSSPNVSACVIDLVLQDRYLARGHVYLCVGRESVGVSQRAAWVA